MFLNFESVHIYIYCLGPWNTLTVIMRVLDAEGLAPLDIPCGFGLSADLSLRCLYDLDEYGNLRGCQSMAHLQNCGKYNFIYTLDMRQTRIPFTINGRG